MVRKRQRVRDFQKFALTRKGFKRLQLKKGNVSVALKHGKERSYEEMNVCFYKSLTNSS